MATSVGDPVITAMIRHHHERLDGAGYPDGLVDAAIPLGARIIAVADTFDAMTSNRAYRRATSHKRALDVLRQESGKQLDAGAVAAFVGYYRGRRTVVWSAFATAAPQRFFAWLGGLTPGVSAGVAGAAALAIGVGTPQPAVVSPASAAARQASKRADVAERDPVPARSAPAGSETGGRVKGSKPQRRVRKQAHRDAAAKKRRKAKAEKPAPRAVAAPKANPQAAKPGNGNPAKPDKTRPARPDRGKPESKPAKPDTGKPAKADKTKPAKADTVKPAQPQAAKPNTAKPAQPQATKPVKVKPLQVAPPAAQPPKVNPPTPTVPAVELKEPKA